MEKSCIHNSELFCLNCADGPTKKTTKLEMEKLELLSFVPCSRDGFAEDMKLKTPIILNLARRAF